MEMQHILLMGISFGTITSCLTSLARSSEGLEKAMAPHSSTLAWKLPWTEEPVGLPSMGSHRVGHD